MNTPCKIVVVLTQDNDQPLSIDSLKNAAITVSKLFRYGVRNIKLKGPDSLIITLSYCPKDSTLYKKLGNLPVRYLRVTNADEEELQTVVRVLRQYEFNIYDPENIQVF